jgi:hypothetical protein
MAEANKAVIRCPGCAREVVMPAASCPTCGFDFRAGRVPAPEAGPALDGQPPNRSILYLAAAAVVMLLIAVGYLVFGADAEPPEVLGAPGGGSILQPVPANPPPLGPISPAKTIRNAQGVADQADERVRQARELADGQ